MKSIDLKKMNVFNYSPEEKLQMAAQRKQRRQIHKVLNWLFWLAFSFPFLFLVVVFGRIANGKEGFMPTFEDLENPKSNLASQIFSADEQLLGKYFRENRNMVEYDELSVNLVDALVATEDIRFYNHSGIDLIALGRVAKGVVTGNSEGGGSTLSQQLAKNLFRMRDRKDDDYQAPESKLGRVWEMVIIKFKEWVTAVRLERSYTKNEILAMYLNTVEFGSNSFGIKSAARTFFDKLPQDLSVTESAMLVGMLKAPSRYSPVYNQNLAIKRREVVLNQMRVNKLLDKEAYDTLKTQPIELNYNVSTHRGGLGTYFREYLRGAMTAKEPDPSRYASHESYAEDSLEWATDPLYGWCNKNYKPDGTPYDLYSDGIRIFTTIDSRMQRYAEEAVAEHMGNYLQEEFMKDQQWNNQSPFAYDLERNMVDNIINSAVVRSERYRVLRQAGMSKDSILANFKIPTPMRVFTWNRKADTAASLTELYAWMKDYDNMNPGDVSVNMRPIDSVWYYKHFMHAGFISMEPATGYVKAYVGDINYEHFKFDNVNIAKRQVGSTFKPFVYTLAMLPGELSPCFQIPNVPVVIQLPDGQDPPTYEPKFSTGAFLKKYENQKITLKFGLSQSLNQISAWLIKKYGPRAVIDIARRMGIRSYLPEVYSLCVGSAEVHLSEMVSAYSTFANKGVHTEAVFVTRIEDKNGNVIANFTSRQNEAISQETAYKMLFMMRGVVEGGTSVRLRYQYKFENQIAAKTGTTNDNSDGWFIGMVPDLVSGAWVGGEERSIRFNNSAIGQGAGLALPIWAMYMQKVYADPGLNYSKEDFEVPLGMSEDFDCGTNQDDIIRIDDYKIDDDEF